MPSPPGKNSSHPCSLQSCPMFFLTKISVHKLFNEVKLKSIYLNPSVNPICVSQGCCRHSEAVLLSFGLATKNSFI